MGATSSSSDLVLWPALALSGAHFVLLFVGVILIYRLSRKLWKERNDNVLELAKAKIKKQRHLDQVAEIHRQREEQQQFLLETYNQQQQQQQEFLEQQQQAASPPHQRLLGSRGAYGSSAAATQQQQPVIAQPPPALTIEQLAKIEQLLTPTPLSPETQRILAEEERQQRRYEDTDAGIGGEDGSGNHNNENADGERNRDSGLMLSSSAFDRFTFAMISLLPIVVFFCSAGMWIGYIMRSENAYWVGALPLFQFVAILAASMYAK